MPRRLIGGGVKGFMEDHRQWEIDRQVGRCLELEEVFPLDVLVRMQIVGGRDFELKKYDHTQERQYNPNTN